MDVLSSLYRHGKDIPFGTFEKNRKYKAFKPEIIVLISLSSGGRNYTLKEFPTLCPNFNQNYLVN